MVLRTLSGDSPEDAAAQRRLFDALPAAVFTCTARGRLTYVNPVWHDLLGYTEQELLAMPYDELAAPGTVRAWFSAVASVATAGAAGFAIEKRLRHRDGSIRWIQCNVNAVRDATGQLRGLLGVGVDVGERRRGEILQAGLRDVLEEMARGTALERVLARLAQVVEDALNNGASTAIFLARPDGTLAPAATTSLPPEFAQAMDAAPIAEGAGACGTAAFRGEAVFVHDIASDPRGAPYRALAAEHGIAACWSAPILSSRGQALGAFAVYYRRPRAPTQAERTMLEIACRSATVALERARAEEALRARGEQARRTIEDAPIPVMLHAEDGQVLQLSAVWTEITGYTRHDTAELQALLARVYRADADDLAEAIGRRLAESGPLLQAELEVPTLDGDLRTWSISAASPGRLRDGRRYMIVMALDVTRSKQAEQRLRASEQRAYLATRIARVGIWSYEPAADHFEADARCREICGLPLDEPISLAQAMETVHPDDRQQVWQAMRLALDPEGDGEYHMDMRMLRHDGGTRWTTERAQCLFSGEGETRRPVLLLGSMLDITASRRMQESLMEADRRKDEFLATLAHELRNPLAPLRTCLHVLKMHDADDPQAARLHAMMERQVAHMVRLVDDLLEVSRITRGNIDLRRRPVPLAEVIATAIETSRPLLDQGQHRLEVDLPPPSLMLCADPMRLSQVFTNLLNNAAKYTPPGGRVVVKAHTEGDQVVVCVSDNGIGLPAEMLVQVFDMFTQSEHSRAHAQGGLGIGLTLVRSLVEQHGGSVEARSEGLGKGSEFLVRLPLLESTSVAAADAVREPAPHHHARSVLIADDNHESADSMALFLRLSGHDVRTVYDGRACLEAIEERRPDVVLLDIGMPLLDGYETCRRIRALPGGKQIAVLATTGWGQDADRERSSACGFDAHLVKPVDPGALLARLDTLDPPHAS